MYTEFDTAVYGGGLSGLCAAVHASRKGEKTILITNETFLGDEMTAALRPWVMQNEIYECGDILGSVFNDNEILDNTEKIGNEYLYRNGDIKRKLLETAEANGITILFMSRISAVLEKDNMIHGLMLSNTFGIQLIYCRRVIDASVEGDIFSLFGEHTKKNKGCGAKYVMAFANTGEDIDCEAVIRTTAWDNISYFEFNLPSSENCQEKMYEIKTAEQFRNLRLVQTSYRVFDLCDSHFMLSQKYSNLVWAHPGIPEIISTEYLKNCEIIGQKGAEAVDAFSGELKCGNFVCKDMNVPLDECSITPVDDKRLGFLLFNVDFDFEGCINRSYKCDVAVAGAGTGGVAAAKAAAIQGADVILTEYFPAVGGTQSLGRVADYYHGYINGFSKLDKMLMEIQSGLTGATGRQLWYFRSLRDCGVRILTDTVICGVIKHDNGICAVVAADKYGLFIIRAHVTVDSTGDSRIAVFSGADFFVGSDKDGVLQDCSQWEINGANVDLDVIDPERYSELLRGIHLAHMQRKSADFCPILTQRESVRIDGEYFITMKDILQDAWYEDAICVCLTDCDPHGAMSSLYSYMGFTPYHGEIIQASIPYRACIPKGINGLLIASKGISADQDAASYARMAADVQNRGYALGIAAAMAAENETDVRDIDITRLRNILMHTGILPYSLKKDNRTSISAKDLVEELSSGSETALKRVLCLERSQVLPFLRESYQKSQSDDTALALGWFGDFSGYERLRSVLKDLNLKEQNGMDYINAHPTKAGNHKGGILGKRDNYWKINQILTVFSILGDKSCLEEAVQTAFAAEAGGSPIRTETEYVKGRIDLYKIPYYDRIRCICLCADSIPDYKWIAPLEQLLKKPYIGGYAEKNHTIGIYFQGAYLQLLIARALSKCGSEKGTELLKLFLNCESGVLSKCAQISLFE